MLFWVEISQKFEDDKLSEKFSSEIECVKLIPVR
jgi:hypothetical protein